MNEYTHPWSGSTRFEELAHGPLCSSLAEEDWAIMLSREAADLQAEARKQLEIDDLESENEDLHDRLYAWCEDVEGDDA